MRCQVIHLPNSLIHPGPFIDIRYSGKETDRRGSCIFTNKIKKLNITQAKLCGNESPLFFTNVEVDTKSTVKLPSLTSSL